MKNLVICSGRRACMVEKGDCDHRRPHLPKEVYGHPTATYCTMLGYCPNHEENGDVQCVPVKEENLVLE